MGYVSRLYRCPFCRLGFRIKKLRDKVKFYFVKKKSLSDKSFQKIPFPGENPQSYYNRMEKYYEDHRLEIIEDNMKAVGLFKKHEDELKEPFRHFNKEYKGT